MTIPNLIKPNSEETEPLRCPACAKPQPDGQKTPPNKETLCPHCCRRARQQWARWKQKPANKTILLKLYVTYGGCCHICATQIPHYLQHPHPLSLTYDHLIAIKNGGNPTRITNIAPAHRICNQHKNEERYITEELQTLGRETFHLFLLAKNPVTQPGRKLDKKKNNHPVATPTCFCNIFASRQKPGQGE